jgi:hypothetical protein
VRQGCPGAPRGRMGPVGGKSCCSRALNALSCALLSPPCAAARCGDMFVPKSSPPGRELCSVLRKIWGRSGGKGCVPLALGALDAIQNCGAPRKGGADMLRPVSQSVKRSSMHRLERSTDQHVQACMSVTGSWISLGESPMMIARIAKRLHEVPRNGDKPCAPATARPTVVEDQGRPCSRARTPQARERGSKYDPTLATAGLERAAVAVAHITHMLTRKEENSTNRLRGPCESDQSEPRRRLKSKKRACSSN